MYRAAIALTVSALTLGLFTAAFTVEADTDQMSNWCDSGIKLEPVDTPFTVPEPPDGYRWSLLVLAVDSAESATHLVDGPMPDATYSHPAGAEISHVFLCDEAETPPTSSTTSTTTTSSTTTTTTLAPPAPTSPSTTAATTTTTGATTTTEPSTTSTVEAPAATQPPPETTPTTGAVREQRDQLPDTGVANYLPVAAIGAAGLLALGGAALYGTRKHN